eukprot:gnl/Hemi2/4858_TR1682_c0_g1_i1.p1 gnl/Hemi2/4858_TR1682_c0_g1~~gnl/Hemi2/4858_TR1682_c0_g1_i1.p1  ORF type:complete len:123 (-),score=30.86 gnl/Hemi2/4858_TR1682_c0_g1_i1:163-531(-)
MGGGSSVQSENSGTGEYENGLFQCHKDCSACLCVLCFYPCAVGRARGHLNHDSMIEFNFPWCFCALLTFINPFAVTFFLREKVQDKYGIKDSSCSRVCTSVFCFPCALCQDVHQATVAGQKA